MTQDDNAKSARTLGSLCPGSFLGLPVEIVESETPQKPWILGPVIGEKEMSEGFDDTRWFLLPTTQKDWREALEHFCSRATSPQDVASVIVLREMMAFAESMQWIPVSERLPERPDYVIARCRGRRAMEYLYAEGVFRRHGEIRDVTHWMPLPSCPS